MVYKVGVGVMRDFLGTRGGYNEGGGRRDVSTGKFGVGLGLEKGFRRRFNGVGERERGRT